MIEVNIMSMVRNGFSNLTLQGNAHGRGFFGLLVQGSVVETSTLAESCAVAAEGKAGAKKHINVRDGDEVMQLRDGF